VLEEQRCPEALLAALKWCWEGAKKKSIIFKKKLDVITYLMSTRTQESWE
jgi:hypothetical protein